MERNKKSVGEICEIALSRKLRSAAEKTTYEADRPNTDFHHEHDILGTLPCYVAVELAAESIVVTDTDGTIQYVNPAFERTSGFTREEAIGQNPRVRKSGNHEEAFYVHVWGQISQGQVWTGHFINKRKDGSLYEEDATISPVRDRSGKIVNFVSVSRDVTREAGLEKQLREAQKMEAVGRLAGGVAHDFNNLLTVIIGYSQLLLIRLPEGEAMRREIEEIKNAGIRAAALTNQLLVFSRKQVVQPTVLDLNVVVAGIVKMLRRLIGEDVDLTTVMAPGLGSVKADPGHIEQVIMNLVVNARDALSEGGSITIETANVELDDEYASQHLEVEPGPYVALSVSDNGAGIDSETRSHIFEPFFTTKEQGKGTGLGLSTVYEIVKQSGGHISVYSEPGLGTTFKVHLPRVNSEAETSSADTKSNHLPRGSETVLLVEDDVLVRRFAGRVLRELGYTVLEASDGEAAFNILREDDAHEITLMLTDIVMPRLGGKTLTDRVRFSRPGLKVLFTSGYAGEAVLNNKFIDENAPFLQKPFTPSALALKVREVIDG